MKPKELDMNVCTLFPSHPVEQYANPLGVNNSTPFSAEELLGINSKLPAYQHKLPSLANGLPMEEEFFHDTPIPPITLSL